MSERLLTAAIGGGCTLTRSIAPDGGVSISILDPEGRELFAEQIASHASRPSPPFGPSEPDAAEQASQ